MSLYTKYYILYTEYMSWAGRRRAIYLSSAVAILLVLFGVPLYFILDKPPTCFDGNKNGDERGVDCGGGCLLLCPFEMAEPFVLWSRSFKITDGVYSAVAYIEHSNSNAGVLEAPYIFKLFEKLILNGILVSKIGKFPSLKK